MASHAGIPCTLMRGGTSKGAYFLSSDLPSDRDERNQLLLQVMGSPDPRQIDGLGGGDPLTSKVAIVSRSTTPGVAVDYLFVQVGVDTPTTTETQNCGNLLAGIAAFAIEKGLVDASPANTTVEIRMVNTDTRATAIVETPGGTPRYSGTTVIAGVPGAAAPVRLYFSDLVGATCGALLPTGSVVDRFNGVETTCIDHGMPAVLMRAESLGITGYESCRELEANAALRATIESIRISAGAAMGLGDVTTSTIPKMTIISTPRNGGTISTRSFIPHRCHSSIGVLAAVSAATGCLLENSVAHDIAEVPTTVDGEHRLTIEHPTGGLEIILDSDLDTDRPTFHRAGVVRTTRKIFEGLVYPRSEECS